MRRQRARIGPGFRRISPWLRGLALLAAALVAGQHALPSLHHALTRHEVCADHGELVHDGEPRASAPRGAPVQTGVEADDQHGDGAHDHCGVTPSAPLRAPGVAASAGILLPPLVALLASSGQRGTSVGTDILSFAPKQSPPA